MHPVGADDDVKFVLSSVAESDTHAALVLIDCSDFDSKPNLEVC